MNIGPKMQAVIDFVRAIAAGLVKADYDGHSYSLTLT